MNILITGAWGGWENCQAEMERMGHRVAFLQQEKDPLPVPYEWVEGTVCNGLFLHHDLQAFTNLRYIQLTSAGFDRIPMDQAQARNIRVYNARGVYSIPMAEFALNGVLQLYKHSQFFRANQRLHRWEKHRNLQELAGKTVCIVGCGSVGTECAKRFRAFGCRVVGIDLCPRECSEYEGMYSLEHLDDALSCTDVAVLTLPLTEDTRNLFDTDRLARMKPGAVLVNIARGGIVDTEALVFALRNRLGGAVLDVINPEPLPDDSPLWDMENVILTPHNSFVGQGNSARLASLIMKNLEKET